MNQLEEFLNYGMITDILSEELKQEIDFDVLRSLLKNTGWCEVIRKQPMTSQESIELDSWVETYCKHQVKTRGLVWLFESKNDANWFSLRWL